MWAAFQSRSRANIDYRLVITVMFTALTEQTVVSILRVTTSYRAVELGLSVVWLGVITAIYAILPIIFAVQIGRFIDRGNDAKTAWIGGGLLVLANFGFALSPSLLPLLLSTALLGVAHLLLVISQQVICTRETAPGVMDRMLGNYMVANAIGQGIGPSIVGWVGGSAAIPPTGRLFWIALFISIVTAACSLLLRPNAVRKNNAEQKKPVPIAEIARIPGIRAIFFVSVVTVAAQDLIVVYMPLLGSERGISVDSIGMLLAVRAAASMLSRFLFSRLNEAFGRERLTVISTFASAASYIGIALPLPLAAMYAMLAAAGFALGISVTVSIASLLALASDEARGTANSLRMMGNRIGQFTIPFLAGLLAAATGAAGIFFAIGVSLAASAAAVRYRQTNA
jgi:predicted MFS family arabinose efflux permease